MHLNVCVCTHAYAIIRLNDKSKVWQCAFVLKCLTDFQLIISNIHHNNVVFLKFSDTSKNVD